MLIVPMVSLALLVLQKITGYQFSNTDIQMVSDAILSVMVLLGFAAAPTVDHTDNNNDSEQQ